MRIPLHLSLALLAGACSGEPGRERQVDPPAAPGARAPALELGGDGVARLSWVEPLPGGEHELCGAVWNGRGWSAAEGIARGADWFVNWADVPRLSALASGARVATFLQRSGSATYDYRAMALTCAPDGLWRGASALHDDAGPGEHGFVSLAALDERRWFAVWLDGRAAAGAHGMEGEMQLRGRVLGSDGSREPELLLDPRVCDCCATATVRTAADELLVVYRDRSADEVRDLAAVRVLHGSASEPRRVWDDGWKIPGCPVNGPALAARDSLVGLAWFTLGADSRARVQVSFSTDGGGSFDTPREVSRRDTDGFVDCAFDARGTLWVTWLERADREHAQWMLAAVTIEGVGEPRALADTLPGRAAGVARIEATPEGLLFAWLEPGERGRLRALSMPSVD